MTTKKQNSPSINDVTNMNVLYTQEDMQTNQEQCRICLEPQNPQYPLIIPCKCTGSVRFVHKECLREWVQRQYEAKNEKITCELCKFPLTFTTDKIKQCNDREAACGRIKKYTKVFLFVIFLILVTLCVDLYLLLIIVQVCQKQPKAIQIGVISFSIVLVSIILIILIHIFSYRFLLSQKNCITDIVSYAEIQQRARQASIASNYSNNSNFSKARIHPINITDMD